MAAANSDQDNVLLQSDEGSPSAPPPAGRLPFKAALAVGLCVFAAGLAGAVMMGRPAARAPINIWHQSAIGLSEHHEFKHMTKECTDLLDELEKEAEEEGRTNHEADSHSAGTLDCKEESEQACTIDYSMYGMDITQEKCFPAVCKEANIFKELEAAIAEAGDDAQVTGLEVSCVGADPSPTPSPTPSPAQDDGDGHEFHHMTKECVDLLETLEKEAEEEGRTHEADSHSAGTLDCKEESEQACTVDYSMYGMDIKLEKCFPAVCKEANIFKELEASMAEVPPEAELSGLEVSCSGGEEGENYNGTGEDYCESMFISDHECKRSSCCDWKQKSYDYGSCLSAIGGEDVCHDVLSEFACPEEVPAVRIEFPYLEGTPWNGVYLKGTPWNNDNHWVKDNKFHLYRHWSDDYYYYYDCLDDRDQSSRSRTQKLWTYQRVGGDKWVVGSGPPDYHFAFETLMLTCTSYAASLASPSSFATGVTLVAVLLGRAP